MTFSIAPLWPQFGSRAIGMGAAGPLGGGRVAKPAVISMPSPNQNARPAGTKIDTIVLHHTAGGGTAQGVGRFFQNPSAQVSSHYIVGKDGAIVQSVSDSRRSWHAGTSVFRGRGDVNDYSIGIEIVNHGNGTDPYTDAQYRALGKLVAFLQSQYGIPADRIIGHKDVAIPYGRKIDPSRNFSYTRLRQEVARAMGGQAPAPAPAPSPAGTYTVRSGDTLGTIAARTLGSASRWAEIYNANRDKIANPNVIYPGLVLRIPRAQAPAPPPPPPPAPPAPSPPPPPRPPAPAPSPHVQGEMERALRFAFSLVSGWLNKNA